MIRSNASRLLCCAVIGIGGAACLNSDPVHRLCSDVGCVSGLHVTFDGRPDSGIVVQAEVPGGSPWRVECGVDQPCQNGVFFPGLRADRLSVRISSPAGEVVHEIRPEYAENRPNGPGCEPVCFNATAQLALP